VIEGEQILLCLEGRVDLRSLQSADWPERGVTFG
jgi:hypothetical protein